MTYSGCRNGLSDSWPSPLNPLDALFMEYTNVERGAAGLQSRRGLRPARSTLPPPGRRLAPVWIQPDCSRIDRGIAARNLSGAVPAPHCRRSSSGSLPSRLGTHAERWRRIRRHRMNPADLVPAIAAMPACGHATETAAAHYEYSDSP